MCRRAWDSAGESGWPGFSQDVNRQIWINPAQPNLTSPNFPHTQKCFFLHLVWGRRITWLEMELWMWPKYDDGTVKYLFRKNLTSFFLFFWLKFSILILEYIFRPELSPICILNEIVFFWKKAKKKSRINWRFEHFFPALHNRELSLGTNCLLKWFG